MSMMSEFKTFTMRGNVVDMAVGIIIGGAFGKIVSSFVNDILMPPIGVAIGGVDFAELSMVLQEAAGEAEAVTVNYGAFIQTVLDFIIIRSSVVIIVIISGHTFRLTCRIAIIWTAITISIGAPIEANERESIINIQNKVIVVVGISLVARTITIGVYMLRTVPKKSINHHTF